MNTVLIDRRLLTATLMFLLAAGSLTGCNTPKEQASGGCTSDEECEAEETCLNQGCQPLQCDIDEIACGRDCVNPRIELEFCGGCNGCPGTDNAEGIQCLEGQCIYRCLDGFVDVNDDINDPNGDGCECVPDGPEVCDGVDNDCDGLVDAMDDDLEPCDAEDGTEAACIAGVCELACSPGFVDVNGDLGTGGNGCECQTTGDEVCDGQDNDCDGLTDTEDDDLEASEEVCDGIDNDCDGLVDDQDADFITPLCQLTQGVCVGLSAVCEDGAPAECSEEAFTEHADDNGLRFEAGIETFCDGEDNNCDGQVDEICCGQRPPARELLTGGPFTFVFGLAGKPDGTQGAAVIGRDTALEFVLFDADGQIEATVTDQGFHALTRRIDIIWEPSLERYVVARSDHNSTLLRVTQLRPDGSAGLPMGFELETDLQEFKLHVVSQSTLLIIGFTREGNLELITLSLSEGVVTGRTTITSEEFSGDGEPQHIRSISSVSTVNATTLQFTGESSMSNSTLIFNDRSTFIARAIVPGPIPVFQEADFYPAAIENSNTSLAGSRLYGNYLYDFEQDIANETVSLRRRRIVNGPPGGPSETLATFEGNAKVRLDEIVELDQRIFISVDFGNEAGNPRLFEFNEDDTPLLRTLSLGLGFGDTQSARKHSITVPGGVWTLTRLTASDESTTVHFSRLNREANFLCPWQE